MLREVYPEHSRRAQHDRIGLYGILLKLKEPHCANDPRRRGLACWRGALQKALAAASLLLLAACALAARDVPPLIAPPAALVVPSPAIETLPNGMKVLVVEDHALPVITLKLAIESGAAADPSALPGAAQFTASMLDEGTQTRGAQNIAAAVDDMGAIFDSGADWDDSWASLSVLSNHAQEAFDLLSDMARNAAFRRADVERMRRQMVSALDVLRRDPAYVADTVTGNVIFAGTPYGHAENGDLKSMKRLSRGDLLRFYRRYYRPWNAVLAVVGDIRKEEAVALAQKTFGGWAETSLPVEPVTPPSVAAARPREKRILVVDDPQSVQTEIRIADPGVPRASPQYLALTAANQVLGGPAENRLFSALRLRRGLVYGASSDLVCYRTEGAWEIKTSTRTSATAQAVRVILNQMKNLRNNPINSQELVNAQEYLVGHMALEFETSQQLADRFLNLMIYHLPPNTWNTAGERTRSLSVTSVTQATSQYLDPTQATIVLVGNASGFVNSLKKLGPARIIPLTGVDFSGLNDPTDTR